MSLDAICQMTKNPQMLNALHACRQNHPLNNAWQWRNAYALAAQRPSYEVNFNAAEWLRKQAEREAAGCHVL